MRGLSAKQQGDELAAHPPVALLPDFDLRSAFLDLKTNLVIPIPHGLRRPALLHDLPHDPLLLHVRGQPGADPAEDRHQHQTGQDGPVRRLLLRHPFREDQVRAGGVEQYRSQFQLYQDAEYQQDQDSQKKYLDFLRAWLKDKEYVALAYMTGILPIKKYGSHSALNMFTEYSMTDPGELAEYFGFTGQEVAQLCQKYEMDFDEAKAWYDGYGLVAHRQSGDQYYSMYSPKSVVEAMLRHKFGTYWNQTETYEALKIYIQMNMDGLQDSVVRMLAGEAVYVNIGTFSNDMTTFATKDDVLTLLVHLGYLTYNSTNGTVEIPNKEVSKEYVNAISTMSWHGVADSVEASRRLLDALWKMDADTVAAGIDKAHEEISILQYNDENSLSCTVSLAFYFAREYYAIVRELPSGKGFTDICMIPRKHHLDKPAIIIELKWDKGADAALAQIKEKQYGNALKDYHGNLLLVGINYDKSTKKHECVIESMKK